MVCVRDGLGFFGEIGPPNAQGRAQCEFLHTAQTKHRSSDEAHHWVEEEESAALKFREALKINPENSKIYYSLGKSFRIVSSTASHT